MEKLIFVYNAQGGKFKAVLDAIHKAVSPKTLKCRLYKITFGLAKTKKDWKQFINNLSISSEFLHKDEFKKKYDYKKPKFPAVFINREDKIKQIISASEINDCKTLKDLKNLVIDKIASITRQP